VWRVAEKVVVALAAEERVVVAMAADLAVETVVAMVVERAVVAMVVERAVVGRVVVWALVVAVKGLVKGLTICSSSCGYAFGFFCVCPFAYTFAQLLRRNQEASNHATNMQTVPVVCVEYRMKLTIDLRNSRRIAT
jgi:hypothetical protein